jgi:hypothetical protein
MHAAVQSQCVGDVESFLSRRGCAMGFQNSQPDFKRHDPPPPALGGSTEKNMEWRDLKKNGVRTLFF